MDHFMERAVDLALANVKDGGQPFGAVLVKSDEVIAEGVNELHKVHDVSGHAEMLAIRRAQEKLKTNDLSDCVMYASGEPCSMCLTAMYFAGIDTTYYCQSVEDAVDAGLGKSAFIYEELQKPKAARFLVMKQIPLKQSQDNPMKQWERQR
ncbi:tRNA(Arg) A34 adenosine deaminase TadA [Alteribacillus persepolensis]|uniref:tRNA(Arg) A34 adenosine deaminase TadA n=1 Tax=Alteribacillus persepolensis TaxID=568899 RepID=A0A1G8BZL3_9BACI|nr:nucleoside deaminase [Alteribacillus persepolensis]SDH38568.1 tRNA(Arg) A34 adenosine deaminase TadA [Alteribacillus persepolensis]